MTIIFAGLIGGILWNLLTWLFGIPSSSSHALFGGLIGAGLAALGTGRCELERRHPEGAHPRRRRPGHRLPRRRLRHLAGLPDHPQRGAEAPRRRLPLGPDRDASLVALSHGTNDAQKTMGVIALALITTGHLTGDVKNDGLPFWIIFSCALAIGLGTYIGGWRVIRTLGKGLVEIESPQGFAAEASSAAIILSSSAAGMALSTTHVATGSILGSGVGKPGAEVRWAVAGRMAVAWLITLPAAGLMGALSYWLSHGVESLTGSDLAGDGLIFVILCALSFYIWWRAQQQKVDSSNVNADWDASTNSVVPAEVREAAKESKPTAVGLSRADPLLTKGNVDELPRKHPQGARRGTAPRCGPARGLRARPGGLLEWCRRRNDADGTGNGAQSGAEVPRARAVRVRRLGDPHRGPLDHQDDDHPPLRC